MPMCISAAAVAFCHETKMENRLLRKKTAGQEPVDYKGDIDEMQ